MMISYSTVIMFDLHVIAKTATLHMLSYSFMTQVKFSLVRLVSVFNMVTTTQMLSLSLAKVYLPLNKLSLKTVVIVVS